MAVSGTEPVSTGDLLSIIQAASIITSCATLLIQDNDINVVSAEGITCSGENVTMPSGIYLMNLDLPGGFDGEFAFDDELFEMKSGQYFITGGTHKMQSRTTEDIWVTLLRIGGGGSSLLDLIAALGGER